MKSKTKAKTKIAKVIPFNDGKEISEIEKSIIGAFIESTVHLEYIKREIEKKELWLESYFGLCDVCGKAEEYLNIGRSHIVVCHKHKRQWWIGSNLFSSWRNETEEIWKRNAKRIHKYKEIDGLEYYYKKYPEERPEKQSNELPF